MSRIVNAYLDLAELRASDKIPMTMEDWAEQFDGILRLTKREILDNAGSISARISQDHALSEFEKYRVKQDALYQNDFDQFILEVAVEPGPDGLLEGDAGGQSEGGKGGEA